MNGGCLWDGITISVKGALWYPHFKYHLIQEAAEYTPTDWIFSLENVHRLEEQREEQIKPMYLFTIKVVYNGDIFN
jgi:hypothetical protein